MRTTDPAAELATRIKQARKARGWTLIDLAARSGVSRAMISKVERGEASPTATIIGRLSAAFGMTMSEMLSVTATDRPASGVQRAENMSVWRDPETGYMRRQVATTPDWPIDVTLVNLPPGQHVSFPASAFKAFRHLILVQHGSLRLTVGETAHQLNAGDRLILGQAENFIYANDGHEPVQYLVMVSRV